MKLKMYSILIFISAYTFVLSAYAGDLPKGFVYLDDIIPDVSVELRYAGNNNFIGEPIEGYKSDRCIITIDAAYALKRVQSHLKLFGLGLKLFDAFRPQRAVNHFIRWAEDTTDVKMKQQYYPSVEKSELFDKGYISRKSGHSRGSTVDLTLIDIVSGNEIDMGSPYDYFDEKSHVYYSAISTQQRANRLLLRQVMTGHGFIPIKSEWWHFTLWNEPFFDTYFDFTIE